MQESNQSLLVTKLYRPRKRSTAVIRPRVQQLLDRGQENGWILVAAAAGAGKTTLLVHWAEVQRARSCWLALDSSDNDASRFFTYLIAAIQSCEPTVGQDLMTRLQAAHVDSFDSIVDGLLNQLVVLSEPLIIVLDDYHLIENEEIHRTMARLLSHQIESTTFVLLTRSDPPLPLARMRANGELTEVRAQDLAFTQSEATDFFNDSFGLDLTLEQVGALSERTEGWSAGLQLAALALQTQSRDKESFIRNFTGSHRHVLDYLVDEVLRSQPEAVRDFMMQTSPLYQFDVGLCNAVMDDSATNPTAVAGQPSGAKNAAVMLDYLETHNLFLVPLDDSRQWYRYHHLFADLLRGELEQRQPDAVSQVRQRAATWFEAQGDYQQAIDYASDAGAYEQAGMLMQQHLVTSYWQTPIQTWRRWYSQLPTAFLAGHAHLGFLFGHALLIRGILDDAVGLLRQIDPEQLEFDNRLMYEYMNIHELHDAKSYAALEVGIDYRELSPIGQLMFASIVSAQGEFLRACDIVDNAFEIALQTDDPIAIVGLGPHRCRLHSLAGNLQHARELSESLLEQMDTLPPGVTDMFSFLYMTLGRSLLAQNQLPEAEDILRQGVQFVEKTGFLMSVLPMETMLLAETLMARGDDEGARMEAAHAVTLSERHELRGESEWLRAYQIQILLRQGDLAAATKWLQEEHSPPLARFSPPSIRRLVEAQIYLAQNRTSRAINLLTELTTEPHNMHTVDAWLLLALARQAAGDGQHALIALTTAISLAEPETNLRAFLNQADLHAKSLVRLLARFKEEQPENAFVQTLLSLLPTSEEKATAAAGKVAQANLIEPLGERELEVLRLIVAGHSNKEIAEKLVLALNTIKWYIKVIYGKLGVASRSQAIAKAHELKLVE